MPVLGVVRTDSFFLCIWLFYPHVYLCTTHVPAALEVKEGRASDPLELELQIVVSYPLDVGVSENIQSAVNGEPFLQPPFSDLKEQLLNV